MALLTLWITAALALSGIGPDAGAGVFIEMQSNGALHLQRITIDTVVEDVADAGLGMGKETVLAWTVFGRLGFL